MNNFATAKKFLNAKFDCTYLFSSLLLAWIVRNFCTFSGLIWLTINIFQINSDELLKKLKLHWMIEFSRIRSEPLSQRICDSIKKFDFALSKETFQFFVNLALHVLFYLIQLLRQSFHNRLKLFLEEYECPNTKSLYRSRAGNHFYETEYEMWADLGWSWTVFSCFLVQNCFF